MNQMQIGNKRFERWDNLKFVLIFLVVLGHICDPFTASSGAMRCVFLFIYTVHMPLFLFVSGLFSKKNVNEGRFYKIFSYLVLYVLIKILLSVTGAVVNGEMNFSLFYESGVPWYVLALFAYSLVAIALKNFSYKYILAGAVIFACFVGYDNSVADFLALSRLIVFFPFFFLGYCMDIIKLEKFFSNRVVKLISWIILAGWIVLLICKLDELYWIRPVLTGKNPYSALEKYNLYGGLIRLIYYFIVCVLGAAFIAVIPKRTMIKCVPKIGQRTLQIYALHHVFISLIFGLTGCQIYINKLPWFEAVVAIVLMSAAIMGICSLKFFELPFKKIMNIPKRTRNENY